MMNFSLNSGGLGWINSWGKTAKSVPVGDWTINNIPHVSISIPP